MRQTIVRHPLQLRDQGRYFVGSHDREIDALLQDAIVCPAQLGSLVACERKPLERYPGVFAHLEQRKPEVDIQRQAVGVHQIEDRPATVAIA